MCAVVVVDSEYCSYCRGICIRDECESLGVEVNAGMSQKGMLGSVSKLVEKRTRRLLYRNPREQVASGSQLPAAGPYR